MNERSGEERKGEETELVISPGVTSSLEKCIIK